MLKLLKYELLRSFFSFVVIGGIFLVSMLIIGGHIRSGSTNIHNFWDKGIVSFCIGVAFLSVFLLFVMQIWSVIRIFGKNLFGSYGILLFCLPVSLDSILCAKILSCFILIGCSSLFYAIVSLQVFLVMPGVDVSEFFGSVFEYVRSADVAILVILSVYFLAQILCFLTKILLTLAILNSTHIQSFRFMVGIMIFIGINFVEFLIPFSLPSSLFSFDSMKASLLTISIQTLIIGTIYYFIARWLIAKKIELL